MDTSAKNVSTSITPLAVALMAVMRLLPMVFIWKYLVRPLGGGWNIYELLPAFLVSGIFIVAVSLLTPAPEKEIVEEYESVKA